MAMQMEDLADIAQVSADHGIRKAAPDDGTVRVEWDDGRESDYHWAWLRDNCGCSDCTHPSARERLVDILSWPEDIHPESVSLGGDGSLEIVWSNGGHVSRFGPGWLRNHCYSAEARAARRQAARPWGAELGDDVPMVHYGNVMEDDSCVLLWLRHLHERGIVLVRDVPTELGAVRSVAERIGPVRETNFGAVFDVVSIPKPNSNAYTAYSLPLHTDLPYREQEPGYQLLHCLHNEATGGDSLLVDGLRIAQALREYDRDAFETLSRVRFNFGFTDEQVDYRLRAPVIALDDKAEFREIRFSQSTAQPFDMPVEQMPAAYRSWRKFAALTRDPRYQLQLRLRPGDLISFDNRRVLHARTAFDPASGRRHLQGCYVDREEADSRLRMLERTLAASA